MATNSTARTRCRSIRTGQDERGSPRIAAILGTGRSGTTWLGSIVNAHPELAYRFEPFHRARRSSRLRDYSQRMKEGHFGQDDLAGLYSEIIRADPATDKPPFFPKSGISHHGRNTLFKLTRIAKPLRPLYALRFTPRDGRMVVFKEVTFEKQMDCLLSLESLPLVYLVRHPCATVASLLRGQTDGKMPRGRMTVIRSLLKEHDTDLASRYVSYIDDMDDVELNAVLWRIDTEKAIRTIDRHGRGLLLTYEQLCDDAYEHLRRVCIEFGIDFHPQMAGFLDQLYNNDDKTTNKPRDVRDRYFTVFRNPRVTKEEWKKNWSTENTRKVLSIVSESRAFERCAEMGGW